MQLTREGDMLKVTRLARHSPLQYDHINWGRYAFTRPPTPGGRQLRDPGSDDGTGDGDDG
ncbi:hypothetical protein ACH4VM_04690 [Streptomyces sp. NPDC020792]|uniref:hypothetical protein n=1 Tax=Streptomyces sp. NPDC020792 TaxID=3365089 RepID=UPI0037AD0AA1